MAFIYLLNIWQLEIHFRENKTHAVILKYIKHI